MLPFGKTLYFLGENKVISVFVPGSTDDKGYFEAELDGKVGLVPANYLQPVYPTRPHRPKSVSHSFENIVIFQVKSIS